MNAEQDLLNEIFGQNKYWRGRKVTWCDSCEVWTVGCNVCNGSTCNSMQCEKCKQDQADFHALKAYPEVHMTQEEKDAVYKYNRLKQLLYILLTESSNTLDADGWEWLYRYGKLCDNDWAVFKLKFLPYDIAEMEGHQFYF